MRAKMKINSVQVFEHGTEMLKFSAVSAKEYGLNGSDENNTYARYTPSADLTITITNPDLAGKFKAGDEFYIDFTKASE